jgi:hypothetical protein
VSRVLAMLVVALLLAACTSPKSAIGPSASPCFRTLPTALAAVGNRGHFLGVRLLTTAVVDADLEHAHDAIVPPELAGRATLLCVVGYRGPFLASRVQKPQPKAMRSGRDALVLISLGTGRVIATLLLGGAPLRIGRM